MKDGDYNIWRYHFPIKSYITIKAEHKHKAIWKMVWNQANTWFRFPSDNNAHHINFVDFAVTSASWERGQFSHTSGEDDEWPHHVYFKWIKMYRLFGWPFSWLHADYRTFDWLEWTNWITSHMWYAEGIHLAVINSYFSTGVHDQIAIRWYYPKWETWHRFWYDRNVYVKDRTDRKWFIPKNDWTHYIANNVFDKWWDNANNRDWWRWYHISLAYWLYSWDQPKRAERVYLPPQNIAIINNVFKNKWYSKRVTPIGLTTWAWINNSHLNSVNGIYILNNSFDWNESDFIDDDDCCSNKGKISDVDKIEWNKFNQ
jgi:hypothetical protein